MRRLLVFGIVAFFSLGLGSTAQASAILFFDTGSGVEGTGGSGNTLFDTSEPSLKIDLQNVSAASPSDPTPTLWMGDDTSISSAPVADGGFGIADGPGFGLLVPAGFTSNSLVDSAAVFTLTITTDDLETQISNLSFQYGTNGGPNVKSTFQASVPEPGMLLLFGSVALYGVRRRTQHAPPR
jgi:hypothetical protein